MIEKKNTFCHKLWDGIIIDYNGDVYSCCMRKPALMGNIITDKLEKMINNDIMRNLRLKSLNGELHCFEKCKSNNSNTGFEVKNPREVIDYGDLKTLKITFGFKCNINCVMCLKDGRSHDLLDYEELKQNVDITKFSREIIIQGGEPLFHKETKDFFDYAVSLGQKVSFITNGLLIDDEWAKKIAAHSKHIHISLNAGSKEIHEIVNRGSKWEVVLENIQKLREYKAKLGTNLLIMGHMTVVKENLSDIPFFIENCDKFGFEKIKFGFENKVPEFLKENPDFRNKLIKDVKKSLTRAANKKVDIITHHLEMLMLRSAPVPISY